MLPFGVLRIIVEQDLPLDIEELTQEAARLYGDKLTNQNVVSDVVEFYARSFPCLVSRAGL